MNNKIQREILTKCKFFSSGARFSNLKLKNMENDKFNYHLQYLVKLGFLKKRSNKYYLSEKGKSVVTNIDEETKEIASNYKVSVYLVPVIKGKVLLHKRLKHPQYGYTGFISGKKQYGEKILNGAEREFVEETGLKAKFKMIGNLHQIRRNEKGKVIEDGIFYVCFCSKVTGKLQEKNIEGEYFWIKLEDIKKLKKLFKPSVEVIINEIQKRLEGKQDWTNKFIYEFEPDVEDY